jgi:Na+-transporting NADH:ubiquinone oxidoreductase subunit D
MEWKRFGYGLILVIVSMIRELFGSGELMGYRIIPESIYKLGY